MKLRDWLHELSVLAARIERLKGGAPIVVPRYGVRFLYAIEALVKEREHEEGIDWYRPDTFPDRQEAAN